ncbi:MAG: hypothetical protein GWM98_21135, partial [Nitrospinaceae bacterium]|nr:hypothetical protein [Nitrospinaceae bacterium]
MSNLIAQAGNGTYEGPDAWTHKGESKHIQSGFLKAPITPEYNVFSTDIPLIGFPIGFFWDSRLFPVWQDWWMATFGGEPEPWLETIPNLAPHDSSIGLLTNELSDSLGFGVFATAFDGTIGFVSNAWIPGSGDWGYDAQREFCDLPSSIYHLGGDTNNAVVIDELLGIWGGDGQLGESTSPFSDSIFGVDHGTHNPFSPSSPDSVIAPAGPFAWAIHGQSGW